MFFTKCLCVFADMEKTWSWLHLHRWVFLCISDAKEFLQKAKFRTFSHILTVFFSLHLHTINQKIQTLSQVRVRVKLSYRNQITFTKMLFWDYIKANYTQNVTKGCLYHYDNEHRHLCRFSLFVAGSCQSANSEGQFCCSDTSARSCRKQVGTRG